MRNGVFYLSFPIFYEHSIFEGEKGSPHLASEIRKGTVQKIALQSFKDHL